MPVLSESPYYIGQTVTFRWVVAVQKTELMLPAAAGATTITVGDITGYASTNPIVIKPGHPRRREEQRTVSGTPSNGVITLSSPLLYAHGVGELVGELVAPSGVTFTLVEPDGTSSTPTVSNPSTGVYTAPVTFDQAGQHKWQWRATGTGAGEEEGTADVRSNLIT